ncbi:MAG: hypothetical protein JNM07_15280, partial [Phycisphaerae bacterium]|nr:hypothetical protein [Phycisphaerae bacterium]
RHADIAAGVLITTGGSTMEELLRSDDFAATEVLSGMQDVNFWSGENSQS